MLYICHVFTGAFNKQKQLAVSMDLGGGSSQLSLVPSLEVYEYS